MVDTVILRAVGCDVVEKGDPQMTDMLIFVAVVMMFLRLPVC